MKYDVLRKNPFNLNDEQIDWVKITLQSLSLDEKIGQLFCLIAYTSEEEYLTSMIETYKPGGVMCRPMPMEETVSSVRIMQNQSKLPLLIAANLEKGGNGLIVEGSSLGSQMQVAATDDVDMARKLGEICGKEGNAVGANWAFAPVIDIDYNFRNPITNTRTLGSDPIRVKNMGKAYVKEVQKHGVAASIKHFPGDGCDERDQHLVTSINDLSCEKWDATFGDIYEANIKAGAMTVMIGHIMQPEYSKRLNPAIKDAEILPASLSNELIQGLLREQLGFNGLIVTDATTMAGMVIPMPRRKAVPQTIAAGCDMFLFARNLEEDYEFMRLGIEEGIITGERLDEAVMRILALKATLQLPQKKLTGDILPNIENAKSVIRNSIHQSYANECADKAITLVKEEKGVLPLSPSKYKKVLFYGIESEQGVAYSVRAGVVQQVKDMLVQEGFDIDEFTPSQGMEGMTIAFGDVTDKYDLIIYLANMSTKSNQTTIRIEWAQPMGANVPIYIETVPTVFISVENPYHLLDVPRVKTFINTYASTDETLSNLVDKLMGRSEFKGISPSDPFCGKWDTKL